MKVFQLIIHIKSSNNYFYCLIIKKSSILSTVVALNEFFFNAVLCEIEHSALKQLKAPVVEKNMNENLLLVDCRI